MDNKKNYYLEFVKEYREIRKEEVSKPKLLLHVCCGACSAYPLMFLHDLFDITILFSNSNIYPKIEYDKRLEALKKYVNDFFIETKSKIDIIEDNYDYESFKKDLLPFKNQKEGLNRCKICIAKRMERLYEIANERDFKYVSTVMSVSRNKDSNYINLLNEKMNKKYPSIKYIYSDFKKNNGQEIGIEISKKYNIYRQNYCGCEFSLPKKVLNKYEIGVILIINSKENHLKETLDSIINQDIKIPFITYLIVNKNNINDINLINEYIANYKDKFILKITPLSKEEELNNVIKEIEAKYISFIDSNDILNNDYLSKMYNLINSKNGDIVNSLYYFKNNNKNKYHKVFPYVLKLKSKSNEELAKNSFKSRYLKDILSNKMFKKEFIINNNIFFLPYLNINSTFLFNFITTLFSSKYLFINEYLLKHDFYFKKENNAYIFSNQLNLINSFFIGKFIAFKNNKKESVDTQFIFRRMIFCIESIIYKKGLDSSLFQYLANINKLFNKLSSDHYIYEGEDWEKALFLYNEMVKENIYINE